MNADVKNRESITRKEVLDVLKLEEQIYHPPSWIWKSGIVLSLVGFSLFSIFILGNESKGIFKNDVVAIVICALSALSFTVFSIFKLSTRGFSIRLNHYGIMVTNYSKQNWYSWNTINHIETVLYHGVRITSMKAKIDFKIDEASDSPRPVSLIVPENYDISAHALVKEMLYFKRQFEELGLDRFPELEQEAMANPGSLFDIAWGRPGAETQS